MKALLALMAALLLAAGPLRAAPATPLSDDPVVEARLVAIAEELRCLVCQNESLAGSRADLAQDLRREIRTLIRAGRSDQEVMDFLVSRYGDFVRYRPPLKASTLLLWIGPFALMLGGMAGLLIFLRRRRSDDRVLSEAERQRLADLLAGEAPR